MVFFYYLFGTLAIASEVVMYAYGIYFLMSFFPIDENNKVVRTIRSILEPPYQAILKVLPRLQVGPLDLSPFYIIVILLILKYVFANLANLFKIS